MSRPAGVERHSIRADVVAPREADGGSGTATELALSANRDHSSMLQGSSVSPISETRGAYATGSARPAPRAGLRRLRACPYNFFSQNPRAHPVFDLAISRATYLNDLNPRVIGWADDPERKRVGLPFSLPQASAQPGVSKRRHSQFRRDPSARRGCRRLVLSGLRYGDLGK